MKFENLDIVKRETIEIHKIEVPIFAVERFSTVPFWQSIRDKPQQLKAAILNLRTEAKYYILFSEDRDDGLILLTLENQYLFYRTKNNKIYMIPITYLELPLSCFETAANIYVHYYPYELTPFDAACQFCAQKLRELVREND